VAVTDILTVCVIAGVVTERIKEAHEDRNAPYMLLFPGSCSYFPTGSMASCLFSWWMIY